MVSGFRSVRRPSHTISGPPVEAGGFGARRGRQTAGRRKKAVRAGVMDRLRSNRDGRRRGGGKAARSARAWRHGRRPPSLQSEAGRCGLVSLRTAGVRYGIPVRSSSTRLGFWRSACACVSIQRRRALGFFSPAHDFFMIILVQLSQGRKRCPPDERVALRAGDVRRVLEAVSEDGGRAGIRPEYGHRPA